MSLGGATGIRRFVDLLGPHGLEVGVAACSIGGQAFFERALARAGLGLEAFLVCDPDLEGELIRALGVAAVEDVIELEGERPVRTISPPAARAEGAHDEQRLHGFMDARRPQGAVRPRFVDALDLDRVPKPLDDLLAAL